MTLDEVMALPDDKLNRLAAEKVMGWTNVPDGYRRTWQPTREWNHAMMLNERMNERLPGVSAFSEYTSLISSFSCRRNGVFEKRYMDKGSFLFRYTKPIDITRAAVATAMTTTTDLKRRSAPSN